PKDRPEPRRKGRPHAAPWAIGAEGERPAKGRGDYPDLSDYAARYAAATGRPAAAKNVSAAPWLPPASADPEGQGAEEKAGPEETTGPEGRAAAAEQESRADSAPGEVGGADHIGRSEAGPQTSHAARSAPQAKPPLELDHGTGEQAAMPVEPGEEDTGERGPEWTEHMSVLDQHLIKADTPAPPRPKFADAVPSKERDSENRDPSEWFDDGKRHHPDQPRVGDRDNPVIAVSEIREERRAAAQAREQEAREQEAREQEARERAAEEEAAAAERRAADEAAEAANDPKPSTQLDHGTGELVSFVEVRKEPKAEPEPERKPEARPEARPEAKTEPEPARRPTESELAEAEEAALRSRRREPAPASEAPSEPGTEGAVGHDPHDGVFHRVAQNARRIGQLFGQTAPGEEPDPPKRSEPETGAAAGHGAPSASEPAADTGHTGYAQAREESAQEEPAKPDLELDHGTGEQDRLGDTPSGVPAQRPEPPPAKTAEPAAESGGTRGWRRLAKVVTGGAAPVRSDLPASDIERLRSPLAEPRSLVVLGCTGGAGQTVTALMIGHTLAAHRDDRVVAVDVNPGPNGLSRRIGAQAPETLTALLANADSVDEYERMRAYAGRAGTGLEVVQTLDDPYVQTLDDRDYGQLSNLLGGFYGVTLLDPAATGVARALPVADGLILVAPASADAERAVSMTFEWLDGNGYSNLRANSVLVVNGVSKRSLPDVDAAERVARGRCRAIVRIPWDDHLGSSYTKIDVGALRSATKRAHGALGGVLVNSVAPASTS
ncbi:MinD/ParA family ATP-binding protein, partial [Nocardiopsis nanhaiensis]